MPLRCSILKITLFQSISKPVGAMPRMAILPPLFMTSIMSRKAGAAPDISSPTSKPSVMPMSRITWPSFSLPASTILDAELAGEVEPGRIDVGDHDLARADALGDQRAHDADRSGTGDEHILADQVEGQRRMH